VTTQWCTAHRISLLCKFAFCQSSNREIKPLDAEYVAKMTKITSVLTNLVKAFADNANFNMLEAYAVSNGIRKPYRMNELCPTRFNSFADLVLAVHQNMVIFSAINDDDEDGNAAHLRDCLKELFDASEVTYISADGGERTTSVRAKQDIAGLSIVARSLIRLSKLAETNDPRRVHLRS